MLLFLGPILLAKDGWRKKYWSLHFQINKNKNNTLRRWKLFIIPGLLCSHLLIDCPLEGFWVPDLGFNFIFPLRCLPGFLLFFSPSQKHYSICASPYVFQPTWNAWVFDLEWQFVPSTSICIASVFPCHHLFCLLNYILNVKTKKWDSFR